MSKATTAQLAELARMVGDNDAFTAPQRGEIRSFADRIEQAETQEQPRLTSKKLRFEGTEKAREIWRHVDKAASRIQTDRDRTEPQERWRRLWVCRNACGDYYIGETGIDSIVQGGLPISEKGAEMLGIPLPKQKGASHQIELTNGRWRVVG